MHSWQHHRSRVFGIILILGMTLMTACVGIKELSLYENQGVPEPGIKGFTMTDVYSDLVTSEMWGVEEVACKTVEKTDDVAYKGTSSLHLKWNRTAAGCPWLGFGIGWSNWLGKDLTKIMDTAAIQFYARVDTGSVNYIPIVFLLEGYDGKQAASVMNPLGIEGGMIGQNWTKVRIPLNSFNHKKSGIDLSKIKQLMFQLEGAGDVYLDEITIVPFKNEFGRIEGSLTVEHENLPVNLYADHISSGWGINPQYCKSFTLDSTTFKSGFASIRVDVDPIKNSCKWNEMGFSWTNWLYSDISLFRATAALKMFIKAEKAQELPEIKIGFDDYNGHTAWVTLTKNHFKDGGNSPDWNAVMIPMKQFEFAAKKVELTEIKALRIAVTGNAAFNLDEISLVEFRGNPKYPFGK
mgnify:CR=1 FL=1